MRVLVVGMSSALLKVCVGQYHLAPRNFDRAASGATLQPHADLQKLGPAPGIEPGTRRLQGDRSGHLSYTGKVQSFREERVHRIAPLSRVRYSARTRKPALSETLKPWWTGRGSNPRPSPCKGDALPTELRGPNSLGRALPTPAPQRPPARISPALRGCAFRSVSDDLRSGSTAGRAATPSSAPSRVGSRSAGEAILSPSKGANTCPA